MYVPYLPSRPVDIYTVRITQHDAQTSISMSLRKLVAAAGGTFMLSLTEGPGFMFRMPTTAPCPLTSYLHGGLLEEGCIHVSKMRLEKQHVSRVESEEESDAESVEEDDADHSGRRMQWNWTELKKEDTK
ncbi:hypothetical protein E8E13_004125 [Curvularia kusanoi]|uniref:Uncharacterized protein n=1 Tax=Curvularia kusanoi TaxID=90978 RepID=A0A9P4T539_CURKU|nr:hypothetical protein E8E13_004125 [Curvularia kusanoi]